MAFISVITVRVDICFMCFKCELLAKNSKYIHVTLHFQKTLIPQLRSEEQNALIILIMAQESSKDSYSTNRVCFAQVCFHNLSLYKTQCSLHKSVMMHFPILIISLFVQECISRRESTPASTCGDIVGVQISHLILD